MTGQPAGLRPKVLITGGAGFIGSHLIERFAAGGYQVVVLDNFSTGKQGNIPAGVEVHAIDVGSPEAAALAGSGDFKVIAHLAAQMDVRRSVEDPGFDARTNIIGSLNVLEAARRLEPARRPRFIFASTGGALYGDGAPLPSGEATSADPDAPYGVAKLAVEFYLGYYARVWGMETVALRFGNVYGPRQNPDGEAGVIAIFARRIARRQPVIIYGSGKQTRDFVFVGDVAEAFYAASTRPLDMAGPLEARAFNIGTGVEASVVELAQMLGKTAGVEPELEFRPARSGEVDRSLLAVDKAHRLLDWKARVTLAEGLALTYDWTRGQ
jgi:UDP-glucose 4-epimerase